MKTSLWLGRATALLLALLLASVLGSASSARADTTLVPSTQNGQSVYLSQACHNNTSTGPCQTNYGCNGFSENAKSHDWIVRVAYGGRGAGLLDRQYVVRWGTGTYQHNVADSNNFGSTMHIPMHSNAGTSDCTAPFYSYNGGTWGMYVSEAGRQLAEQIVITSASPGTNDKTVYRNDLYELNATAMPSGYSESAFHSYAPDKDYLNDEYSNAWSIAGAVDRCRGYPRAGQGVTSTKYCSW